MKIVKQFQLKIVIFTAVKYYTIMDFSAGVHDVICTRKIYIDRGGSRGQYYFFWCISHHVHQLKRP